MDKEAGIWLIEGIEWVKNYEQWQRNLAAWEKKKQKKSQGKERLYNGKFYPKKRESANEKAIRIMKKHGVIKPTKPLGTGNKVLLPILNMLLVNLVLSI